MKKQSIILICVILLILTLSIGYAIFRTSTTIVGKSAIVKDLNVIFYEIGDITQQGSKNANAVIMNDKKRIIISVPELSYKGAYAIIPITIKNNGNIPARLESIYEYGTSNQNEIVVSYDGIGVTNEVLNPNDSVTFNVKVAWENDATTDFKNIEFIIKFNFVQA
ncbi:MAG TPA: hypothetical protein IAB68_00730 [Candidatus Aphodocola excrementigallinarum]|uniref:Uncharacterized protein n=1 Tax=Candidatus Aphodocola excrementigallinarum TaxID=2840670 RepID=A0A9D1IM43_9FIRM|nr:hypothetical protein [Candidatus Aphodocola excrementigallinarum]